MCLLPCVDATQLFSHLVNDCEEHLHIRIHHPLALQQLFQKQVNCFYSFLPFTVSVIYTVSYFNSYFIPSHIQTLLSLPQVAINDPEELHATDLTSFS